MASLLRSLLDGRGTRQISTVDDYVSALGELEFYYQGNAYNLIGQTALTGTYGQQKVEEPPNSLEGLARSAYAANGVVFACLAVRMNVFSQVRFQWQRFNKGRPSELFTSPGLKVLEQPWPGGTTQDLLLRIIQDADLAGNSYWVRNGTDLVRLRPDWVWVVMEPRVLNGGIVGWKKYGYLYWEGGKGSGSDPVPFAPQEVMHFAPTPDPLAPYRGMSWLTPVLREVANDKAMGMHKSKFFENAATPNLSVALDKDISEDSFRAFMKMMNVGHRGVENAYKTLYLGGGADVRVIGSDFKQMDFKSIQGHGETRIAAAAGVPPIIVGLSEGLESATYSNYSQARRRFADGTMFTLWQNVAGCFDPLIERPNNAQFGGSGMRLWFDTRDVPFLREDRTDAANIRAQQASTIAALIAAGFTPESAVKAVDAEDWGLLDHTGLVSVQLQMPGAQPAGPSPLSAPPSRPDQPQRPKAPQPKPQSNNGQKAPAATSS